MKIAYLIVAAGLLASCTQRDAETAQNFDAVGETETFRFAGNEPFWGGEVTGTSLRYSTPENVDGVTVAVERFAGLGGLGLSGKLDGENFDMAITEEPCSDTMSDRTYPFSVTLRIGREGRSGCGWTDARPYEGDENP